MIEKIKALTTNYGRLYSTPEGSFPSISTILSATSYNPYLEKWKEKVGEEEAARISKIATDRGEAVHYVLEQYINNVDVEPLITEYSTKHLDFENMTRNLINIVQTNISDVKGQELAVWHPEFKFAGRLDLVGKWNNNLAIIDFKTSKRKKTNIPKDYYIQAAAYATAYNYLFNTKISKIVILVTVENAGVQVYEGIKESYIPELKYRLNEFYKNVDFDAFVERIKSNA